MKKKSAALFSVILITISLSGKEYVAVKTLMQQKKITLIISGNGTYQEYCVLFTLTNLTNDSVFVYIEPGLRLISTDTGATDIVLFRERKFMLKPREALNVPGYGFSAQCFKRAPSKKTLFTLGAPVPGYWMKLISLTNNQRFPATAIQQALWVLTDHIPLSAIYSGNLDEIAPLRQLIAGLTGDEVPWYSIQYQTDSLRLFTAKPERLSGVVDYFLSHTTEVTISVRDTGGYLIRNLMNEVMHNSGDYGYAIDLQIGKWKKGDYKIYIYENFPKIMKLYTFSVE